MRAAGWIVALMMGGSPTYQPPSTLTPASLLLATASGVDEKLLASALSHPDADVRATGARVVAAFSIAPLADAVGRALHTETDPRAGAELSRALLLLRGAAAKDLVEAAVQRTGSGAAGALRVWQERVNTKTVAAVPNDLMFSRTVDVWLPGLLTQLANTAQCRLEDEARFGYVRLTYRRDGKPVKVEIDKANLSKSCASVLAAIGRTTFAADDQPVADGYQQWIVVPFSRAYARCTEQIEPRETDAATRPQAGPKKIKDVRPQYPREMQAQRVSGMVFVNGWVTTRGCVTDLQVTRSTGLPFELEALRAMSGWEFEPARHQGRPVPVRTTLTTNFSIR